VLKCKFNDITTEPQTNQWYRDLIYSALVPCWRDISYGSYDLTGSSAPRHSGAFALPCASVRRKLRGCGL
jgi:hypothetical protein